MKKTLIFAVMALMAFTASAQSKFAYVNFNELVMLMPEADEARAQMNAAQNEAYETLQSMSEEMQSKYNEYQQKQATWSASIKATKEKELNDIQTRINEFQESVGNELNMQQQQLMAPIYQKATEAVSNLAKSGGYTFVFDSTQYLYVDAAQCTDLTPAARKALNIAEGRTLETLQQELQAQQEAAAAQ